MINFGTVPSGTTLYIPFTTYDAGGASVTMTGLAVTDIEIFKDGSTTQRASDAGYELLDTDGIDFDGITGLHGFSIDLSDDTDSGFFAVGSWYWVVVSSVTVDGQTVSFVAATFRVGPPEITLGYTPVDDAGMRAAVGLSSANLGAQLTSIVEDTGTTLPAQVSALNDISAADVWAAATRTLTAGTGIGFPTSAAIAAAVLDEATSGHTTAGTLGKAIIDILADTGELQGDLADGGRLDLLIDSIITAIAALPDAAAINAEVVDALATDTYAEPGSVPAATASLAAKVGFLAALARNKLTQTASTQAIRNDADSGNIATRSVSDDGTTYTQSEWS